MAKINVCNVVVLDNPSCFMNPFQFEITFECFENLPDDLEWKLTYVGSAETEAYDQVLDSVLVGPVPEGRHMFVFQADPPNVSKIPVTEAVGVTVVLLSCSYRQQEFVKVGYFVSNEYSDAELRENQPAEPRFDLLTRNILADQPRVTVHPIKWGDEPIEEEMPAASEGDDYNSENIGTKSFMSQQPISSFAVSNGPSPMEPLADNGNIRVDASLSNFNQLNGSVAV